LLWFGYPLARGAAEGWYPYPFVDVNALGHGGVVWRSAIFLIAFFGAALAVAAVGNRRGARRREP
jgi:hypothetical protein